MSDEKNNGRESPQKTTSEPSLLDRLGNWGRAFFKPKLTADDVITRHSIDAGESEPSNLQDKKGKKQSVVSSHHELVSSKSEPPTIEEQTDELDRLVKEEEEVEKDEKKKKKSKKTKGEEGTLKESLISSDQLKSEEEENKSTSTNTPKIISKQKNVTLGLAVDIEHQFDPKTQILCLFKKHPENEDDKAKEVRQKDEEARLGAKIKAGPDFLIELPNQERISVYSLVGLEFPEHKTKPQTTNETQPGEQGSKKQVPVYKCEDYIIKLPSVASPKVFNTITLPLVQAPVTLTLPTDLKCGISKEKPNTIFLYKDESRLQDFKKNFIKAGGACNLPDGKIFFYVDKNIENTLTFNRKGHDITITPTYITQVDQTLKKLKFARDKNGLRELKPQHPVTLKIPEECSCEVSNGKIYVIPKGKTLEDCKVIPGQKLEVNEDNDKKKPGKFFTEHEATLPDGSKIYIVGEVNFKKNEDDKQYTKTPQTKSTYEDYTIPLVGKEKNGKDKPYIEWTVKREDNKTLSAAPKRQLSQEMWQLVCFGIGPVALATTVGSGIGGVIAHGDKVGFISGGGVGFGLAALALGVWIYTERNKMKTETLAATEEQMQRERAIPDDKKSAPIAVGPTPLAFTPNLAATGSNGAPASTAQKKEVVDLLTGDRFVEVNLGNDETILSPTGEPRNSMSG
ncbi:MAG: hypothetical protein QM752_05770 [Gammaproteobacteria bacterium]